MSKQPSDNRDSGVGDLSLRQSSDFRDNEPAEQAQVLQPIPEGAAAQVPTLQPIAEGGSTADLSALFEDPIVTPRGSSPEGSDSESSFCSVDGDMAPPVTIKTSVELPAYSGHPVNTKFTGKDGPCVELQRVQDWLGEINRIGKAGGWTPETMATQAAMKLVPSSPAHNWLKVVEQSNDADKIAALATWDTFSTLMKAEFGAPTDFGTLVSLLQSFKQEQNELVRDYYNRLVLGYNDFAESLSMAFNVDPYAGEKGDKLTYRNNVVTIVKDFHLMAFFVAGLKPEVRKEIIRSGESSVEKILELAKRFEQAKLQEKKAAANPTLQASALASAVDARLAQLGISTASIAAAGAAPAKKKSEKVRQNVICYYDGTPGHLSSKCTRRSEDRAKGVWRPTVRDPETTKAQWDAMPSDVRNKGAKIWGKPTAGGVNTQTPPPATAPPAPPAATPPAQSYAGAVGPANMEVEFNEYLRQTRQPGN